VTSSTLCSFTKFSCYYCCFYFYQKKPLIDQKLTEEVQDDLEVHLKIYLIIIITICIRVLIGLAQIYGQATQEQGQFPPPRPLFQFTELCGALGQISGLSTSGAISGQQNLAKKQYRNTNQTHHCSNFDDKVFRHLGQ